jgi:ATP/maltotriose-dependent transcriptional regulator MalT
LALLRSRGRVEKVGVAELTMDQGEAHALLQAAGVEPSDTDLTQLIDRAEGWPVGLYLLAMTRGEWSRAQVFAGQADTGLHQVGIESSCTWPFRPGSSSSALTSRSPISRLPGR